MGLRRRLAMRMTYETIEWSLNRMIHRVGEYTPTTSILCGTVAQCLNIRVAIMKSNIHPVQHGYIGSEKVDQNIL